ncbi:MAG: hypothetical protein HZC02_01685 [Candidatus Levybacteria bacterium]|nr:hypothetical protein [Candidatus Levybacteria bacterium]
MSPYEQGEYLKANGLPFLALCQRLITIGATVGGEEVAILCLDPDKPPSQMPAIIVGDQEVPEIELFNPTLKTCSVEVRHNGIVIFERESVTPGDIVVITPGMLMKDKRSSGESKNPYSGKILFTFKPHVNEAALSRQHTILEAALESYYETLGVLHLIDLKQEIKRICEVEVYGISIEVTYLTYEEYVKLLKEKLKLPGDPPFSFTGPASMFVW